MAGDVIRIVIADDHPVVRDGIRGMFSGDAEFEVVADVGTGREAVARAAAHRPDVVLMDLRMPDGDGVWATKQIVDQSLANVLVLTTYDTETHVLPAIEAGATGYLLKDTPRADLIDAVRAAARGDSVLSPPVASRLMGRVREPGRATLSDREIEIVAQVARGSTNRKIAEQLFISEATVKTHLIHIYEKLGVGDRAAAVAAAYERGFLAPGDGNSR